MQLFPGQSQLLGNELPGPADGVFLEVVAEGKIPQHFKEGMVARGTAHIFQIVVLAAHAQTLLGSRRTPVGADLLSQKTLLELHHARIGEQQRRIVARHKGRRGHHGMPLSLEEVQIPFTNFLGGKHTFPQTKSAPGETGTPVEQRYMSKSSSTMPASDMPSASSGTPGTAGPEATPRCSMSLRSISSRRARFSSSRARTFSRPCPSFSEP